MSKIDEYSKRIDDLLIDFIDGKKNYFDAIRPVESVLIQGDLNAVSQPFISVVIPTYRREILLEQAIDSAIQQIDPSCEYEVIVVDNDSDSLTSSRIKELIGKYCDNKLYYYKNNENLGMAGNWNRCIELARGQWVAFLHDDDILMENYINTITNLLEKKTDIGAIISNHTVIYERIDSSFHPNRTFDMKESGTHTIKKLFQNLEKDKLMRLHPFESVLFGNIYGAPTCGHIFLKKHIMNLGGFDEQLFPSFDFFFQYKFNKHHKIYLSSIPFGYYRYFENVSLNPDTQKKFIITANAFRNYAAKKTLSGKIIGGFFRTEQHVKKVDGTIELNKFSGSNNISPEMFNDLCFYRIRPVRMKIFDISRKIYWWTKRLIAILAG